MLKNKNHILDRIGKENPFTVPEGYFDNLTERVMEKLPEESTNRISFGKISNNKRFFHWCSAIAACTIAILCFRQITLEPNEANNMLLSNTENSYFDDMSYYDDEEYQNDVITYAMLDNQDIYNYLSGAEY
jgi:hypothetical protein